MSRDNMKSDFVVTSTPLCQFGPGGDFTHVLMGKDVLPVTVPIQRQDIRPRRINVVFLMFIAFFVGVCFGLMF